MRWEQIQFPTIGEVTEIHDTLISKYGGTPGVLKPDQLESAVMAPQATFASSPLLRTLADLAAAFVFYLSTSHPFHDGNKRTALAVGLTFLSVNGCVIVLDQEDEWWLIVEGVATGAVDRDHLAELLAEQMGDWGEIE